DVHMLHIDRSGKSFQRIVVETVKGSHQPQVLRHTLCQCLRQRVILDRERHIVAQQLDGIKIFGRVSRIALSSSKSNYSDELAPHFQWAQASEQFRRYIAV